MFFLLDNVCSDYALAGTLATVKTAFTVICIAVPVILIISLAITIAKMVINPNEEKSLKKIVTKVIAALVVFFLPTIVSLFMSFLQYTAASESATYNVASCWQAASSAYNRILENPYRIDADSYSTFDKIMANFKEIERYIMKVNNTSSVGADGTGGMGIPRYYQGDYANVVLQGDKTVASSGCGFTSASMVASYLTGESITPDKFVDSWSRQYYIYNGGMSWGLPAATAAHYNLGSVEATTDPERVIAALKNNQPVMCSQTAGLFTSGGHIIVLSGITSDGKILVNDPNANNAINKGYNDRAFDMYSEINPTALQYWIFEAKK